jgi:hypothetical protein
MPLDPNISLSYQPPQIQDPLRSVAEIQGVRNQALAGQLQQQTLQQNQLAIQQQQDAIAAFKSSGGDFGKAIQTMYQQGNPLAFKYQQSQTELQKTLGEIQAAKDVHNKARATMLGNYASAVMAAKPEDRPMIYAHAHDAATSEFPELNGTLNPTYTPDMDPQLTAWSNAAQTPEQRAQVAASQATVETQRQQQQKTAAEMAGVTADSARKEYSANVLGPLWKTAGTPQYKSAYDALPDSPAKRLAPKPETNPTQDDVILPSLSGEQAVNYLRGGNTPEDRFIANYLKANPGKTIEEAVKHYTDVTYHPPIVLVPNAAGGATAQPVRPGATIAPGAQTLQNYTTTAPYTGQAGLTGEEFLKTLQPQVQNTVRQIANGDVAPPPAGRVGGQAIINAASQYDPTFNSNRFTAMKEFSQGGQGKQVNAINTAIGHLDLLDQAAQALKNGTFVPGNAIYNHFVTLFGKPERPTVDAIIQRVSGELNKATGSVGQKEQEEIKKNLSSDFAPEQMRGVVQKNIGLLGEAMDTLKQSYMRETGFPANHAKVRALLTPRAQEALTRMGIDPDTMRPRAAGPGAVVSPETLEQLRQKYLPPS